MEETLNLGSFHDTVLDGLEFCSKVYDFIDQIKAGPGGLDKWRLRLDRPEKKIHDELLPIARYIQYIYGPGNRVKIRWLDGSQQFDAILYPPSLIVENTNVPSEICLEVTTIVHPYAHFSRQMLVEQGGTFGAKSIRINRATGTPDSEPHVNVNDEASVYLSEKTVERITAKAEKQYPRDTVLIVGCEVDELLTDEEWAKAVSMVATANVHGGFRGVFLFESMIGHHAALGLH